jgi:formamidopyrimidine-DNA glycosylase
MPELPDLEVFAANLQKKFKNSVVADVEVTVTRKLNVSADDLKEALEGSQLHSVVRSGKTLHCYIGTSSDVTRADHADKCARAKV